MNADQDLGGKDGMKDKRKGSKSAIVRVYETVGKMRKERIKKGRKRKERQSARVSVCKAKQLAKKERKNERKKER